MREFSELLLEVPDMIDAKALFTFMDGLKPWASIDPEQQELRLGTIKGLDTVSSTTTPTSPKKPSASMTSLAFVEAKIHIRKCITTHTSMDKGVSDNFVSSEGAKWLRLQVEPRRVLT